MQDNRSVNPLDQLYNIVNDLWGAAPVAEEAEPPVRRAEKPAPPKEPEPSFPPFEQFWRTADETVDWTDALAMDHPTDGMTSPALWSFFHSHAEAVLRGDIPAYVEVLKAANPLGDLLPYAQAFNVKAQNADQLTVTFEGLPRYLNTDAPERRRYLAGICLRTARDLMALLPVCNVDVSACDQGRELLRVDFSRQELQKVRFSFVEPVQFVKDCGGVYAEDEA